MPIPRSNTTLAYFVIPFLCGWLFAGQSAAAPLELKLHALANTQGDNPHSKFNRDAMSMFLSEHPHFTVTSATGMGHARGLRMPGGAADSVILMQIAGGIAPDVMPVDYERSEQFIQKGYLLPLDQYVAEMDEAELARRVPPAVRVVCHRRGPDGQMHWYMFPVETRVQGTLLYRRDLFARGGLDPDKPPRTWEQFESCVRKLRSPSRDPSTNYYGFVVSKGDASSREFVTLLRTRGGEILVQSSDGRWRPTIDTEPMLDTLCLYVRLTCAKWNDKSGRTHRGYVLRENRQNVFWSANIAMGFEDMRRVYTYSSFHTGKVGWAAAPYPEAHGPGAPTIAAQLRGIYAGVKHPRIARAAWDWIVLQDSRRVEARRVKHFVEYGWGKFLEPDVLRRYGYTRYLDSTDQTLAAVYADGMKRGLPDHFSAQSAALHRELSKVIEQSINDDQVLAALDAGDQVAVRSRLAHLLKHAQIDIEQRLFGQVAPPVQRRRYRWTVLFLCLMAAAFVFTLLYLFSVFRRNAPPVAPGGKRRLLPYLLILPAAGSVLLWQYYPLIRGTMIAFLDYNVMGGSKFVGVSNFTEVLFDANFWYSVYITLVYTFLYMLLAFTGPIFLALLLAEIPKGKIFFRIIYYLPAVLSGLVVMFLWKSFYSENGPLNTLLGHFGIDLSVSWLESPRLAMLSILLPVAWAGLGPGCLIYLAALKTIPDELYEAAEIDGAGIRRKVFHVTLPGLKMLVLINAIGAFAGAFMASEMILAMTGGGPYTPRGATEVVGLQLFYTGFLYLKFGVANAMACVLGFMLLGFTLVQLRNLSRVEFKGGR